MNTKLLLFAGGALLGAFAGLIRMPARSRVPQFTGPHPESARAPENLEDEVDVGSELSFPASDPPAY